MQRIRIGFQFIFILLVLFSPVGVLGGLAWGQRGAALALASMALLSLLLAFTLERWARYFFDANEPIQASLQTCFQKLSQEVSRLSALKTPFQIYFYPDVAPNALIVRSWAGQGSVLLSQGLLSLLSQKELEAVLEVSARRLSQRGAVLESFCSVLALFLLKASPRGWRSLFFSHLPLPSSPEPSPFHSFSPGSSLYFLSLYPWISFFLSLAAQSRACGRRADEWQSFSAFASAPLASIEKEKSEAEVGKSKRDLKKQIPSSRKESVSLAGLSPAVSPLLGSGQRMERVRASEQKSEFQTAVRKITQATRLWGASQRMASLAIDLVDPMRR